MQVVWDDSEGGNVEHLAAHGVTPEEFEEVLAGRFDTREVSHGHSDHWLVKGFTDAGRFLFIVFEYFEEDLLINPITAYDPTQKEN